MTEECEYAVKYGAVYWGRDFTDAVSVIGSFAPIAIMQKRASAHTEEKLE